MLHLALNFSFYFLITLHGIYEGNTVFRFIRINDAFKLNESATVFSLGYRLYIECDDLPAHKRVLQFMLENNLIQKTKAGKLFNISFKLDDQTRAGEYGADFKSEIKLADFVDLYTGEWKNV